MKRSNGERERERERGVEMGKRKGRSSEVSETLNHMKVEDEQEEGDGGGFFACYLLTSLSPRFKGHTYIGFTVNPRRRIRQHNGEIRCGAWRTKNKRPWEMVLCIYGFPTNIAALQFEWAWQHPVESLAVRKAAVAFKSLSGLANKIKLAYTMLTLPAWNSLNLTVNFFSTKYMKHSAGCPSLPEQMKVQVCSMDELPCYGGEDWNAYENGELKNDDVECDETSVADGLIEEELADTKVHNPEDHQNRECGDTSHAYNFKDHWTSVEETTSELIRTTEENHRENPGASHIQRDNNNNRWPFCLNDSPERGLSSFDTSSNRIIEETMEGRGVFGLIEDCDIELDMDMLTRKQLPNTTDADKSQPTIKSSTIPCEVEVIDIFTPSPSNRNGSRRKKMGVVSSIFPEVIDLTKSPIFV